MRVRTTSTPTSGTRPWSLPPSSGRTAWRSTLTPATLPSILATWTRSIFYGTLPLFLTKAVATLIGRTGYDEIHLVGRVLSGLFDLASVLLLFFLARRLFDWRVGLVASFLLAFTALNIQGSHYFSVDTFLTFFVMLTMWFTLRRRRGERLALLPRPRSQHGPDARLQSQRLSPGCRGVALGVWMRPAAPRRRGKRPSQDALRAVIGSGSGGHCGDRRLPRRPALCLGGSQLQMAGTRCPIRGGRSCGSWKCFPSLSGRVVMPNPQLDCRHYVGGRAADRRG